MSLLVLTSASDPHTFYADPDPASLGNWNPDPDLEEEEKIVLRSPVKKFCLQIFNSKCMFDTLLSLKIMGEIG